MVHAGARKPSGAAHGRANQQACVRCRTRVRAVGWCGQARIMRSVDGRSGKEDTPDGGAMLLVSRREGNRDDGIVQRREASAAAAHSWACGRAKGRGDGKRLGHRWPGTSGMAACWRHGAGRRVSRPPGSVQLRRQRNTRVRASMGTGWRLARGRRMPDMWRSHVDSEDHVWFEDRWMVASLCDE
jgi:hypothetical protein